MNLPNTLTLVRMFLVPLLVVVLLTEFDGWRILGVSKEVLAAAKAAVEQAKLNLGWTKITAPIDGVVGISKAQIGDLIDASTELTSVSTRDPIKV